MTEDRELVERTLEGDRAAFDDIVRRYQDGLFRHLLRLTGRPEEAEDLCQDAFIRFYSALRRFDAARPLAPFLFAIATNLWRQRARETRVEEQPLDDRQPAEGATVVDQAMARLEHDQVLAAVARLRPEQREAVSLYYDQGFSYREIARVTRAPVGTVSTRLRRALEALRRVLPPEAAGLVIVTALQGQGFAPPSLAPAIADSVADIAPAGLGLLHGVWTLWKNASLLVKGIYVALGLAVVGGAVLGGARLAGSGRQQAVAGRRAALGQVTAVYQELHFLDSPGKVWVSYFGPRLYWEGIRQGDVFQKVLMLDVAEGEASLYYRGSDRSGGSDRARYVATNFTEARDAVAEFVSTNVSRKADVLRGLWRFPWGKAASTSQIVEGGRKVDVLTIRLGPSREVYRYDPTTNLPLRCDLYESLGSEPEEHTSTMLYSYNVSLPTLLAGWQPPSDTKIEPATLVTRKGAGQKLWTVELRYRRDGRDSTWWFMPPLLPEKPK